MALAGCGEDMAAFAALHGISVHTVRNWDGRGRVPLARLAEFAKRYGTTLEALSNADESNQPEQYTHDGLNVVAEPRPLQTYPAQVDGFSMRLGTAVEVIEAGLAALGVDAAKVPKFEMAAAVFRLLPWPIPRVKR